MRQRIPILCIVLLALGFFGLWLAELAQPWRTQQLEFLALEQQQIELRLEQIRGVKAERLEEIDRELAAEEEELATSADEIRRLEEELPSLRSRLRRAEIDLEDAQRIWASVAESTSDAEEVERSVRRLRDARQTLEGWQEEVRDRESTLHRLRAPKRALEEQRAFETEEIEALESRLDELARGASRRSWPVIGWLDGKVGVREVVLSEMPGRPAQGPRVDRCATCHLGMVSSTGVGSHPQPDLFVAADSAHPYDDFGCSSCHGGQGRSVVFEGAGHSGGMEVVEAAGGSSILPLELVDAGCASCHVSPRETDWEAEHTPRLAAGRRLGRQLGCGGCHRELASDPDGPRRGPSLVRVAEKTSPGWVVEKLRSLEPGHSAGWMPRFFPAEDGQDAHRDTLVHAVVAYLWKNSGGERHRAPKEGDVEKGRQLFDTLGCSACHLRELQTLEDASPPQGLPGPNLGGLGRRVDAGWLNSWLLNPSKHRLDTPMPSLRLTEDEAVDLTAFLLGDSEGWEGLKLQGEPSQGIPGLEPDPALRRQMVLESLEARGTLLESAVRLEAMDEEEQILHLGRWALEELGCQGCHDLPGFELDTAPKVPLPHLHSEALARWVDSSGEGIHRQGSVVYALTEDEEKALAVWMLAVQREAEVHDATLAPSVVVAEGRRMVERYGCLHCHGEEARRTAPGESAPSLTGLGNKVQASWLSAFLGDPGNHPVRPWLSQRMPDFGLGSRQTETLVRYFVERDGGGLFDPPDPSASNRQVAVGGIFFELLQCDGCHYDPSGDRRIHIARYAPGYQGVKERLHPEFVERWILDPEAVVPGTSMPQHFVAAGSGNGDTGSFLLGALDTPMFAPQRYRLVRAFGDERALDEFLEQPQNVVDSLVAYLWSLEGRGEVNE